MREFSHLSFIHSLYIYEVPLVCQALCWVLGHSEEQERPRPWPWRVGRWAVDQQTSKYVRNGKLHSVLRKAPVPVGSARAVRRGSGVSLDGKAYLRKQAVNRDLKDEELARRRAENRVLQAERGGRVRIQRPGNARHV